MGTPVAPHRYSLREVPCESTICFASRARGWSRSPRTRTCASCCRCWPSTGSARWWCRWTGSRSTGSSASATSSGPSPCAALMPEPVTEIFTAEVRTVTPDTSLDDVMRLMTEHRMRHAPVLVDGDLGGLVSTGDVVKNRMDELETERTALSDYITTAR